MVGKRRLPRTKRSSPLPRRSSPSEFCAESPLPPVRARALQPRSSRIIDRKSGRSREPSSPSRRRVRRWFPCLCCPTLAIRPQRSLCVHLRTRSPPGRTAGPRRTASLRSLAARRRQGKHHERLVSRSVRPTCALPHTDLIDNLSMSVEANPMPAPFHPWSSSVAASRDWRQPGLCENCGCRR
jgi:hypothetical protein